MDKLTYNKILDVVKNHHGLAKDCLDILTANFSEHSVDTLYSILFLEHQKRMRVNNIKNEVTKSKYWNFYLNGVKSGECPGIILRMSEHLDVSPCLVAKLILQKYFEEESMKSIDENATININSYLRDTSLIKDLDLSYEVFLCTVFDILYSPTSETMKHSLGQQYEIKLYKIISNLGLAFRDEEHLRKIGYDKTPDVKLDVPIAVDGFIVNWIESKALFGEEAAHREYMKNQYLSYWNRFGSGLVIYWFGYLETIVEPNDKRFIIRSDFPADIIVPGDIKKQ